MTRLKINYQNLMIYKIVCKDLSIKPVYIGSTTDFNNRKYDHKSNSYNVGGKKYNYELYQFIRKNGSWENWDMLLIENYPCNTKQEALRQERVYYEFYYPTGIINSNKPICDKNI